MKLPAEQFFNKIFKPAHHTISEGGVYMEQTAPLSAGFMMTSIIGFFLALFQIYPVNMKWGFTLMVFFVIMFISAIVSMSHADVDAIIALDKKEGQDDTEL
jgi:hypothetical protein